MPSWAVTASTALLDTRQLLQELQKLFLHQGFQEAAVIRRHNAALSATVDVLNSLLATPEALGVLPAVLRWACPPTHLVPKGVAWTTGPAG